jgi:biotin carboxyl carrier protein
VEKNWTQDGTSMNKTADKNSYRVEVNGNIYEVAFLDNGSVRFDDLEVSLNVSENDTRDHYSLLIDHISVIVGVEPQGEQHEFRVHAGGYDFDVEVLASREAFLREYLRAVGVGKKQGKVKATMPGLIRKLLVHPGDTVAAGQGIVIMEAMKMENEIKTPVGGTLAEFGVSEGQAVEKGVFLFEVETA